jgi:Phosphotransferase enzyme family
LRPARLTPLETALSLAREHGLRVTSPVVLRDSSNLLVHLRPAPVVARVATTTSDARGGALDWLAREVDVAGFLAERGVPVVGPAAELPAGPHLHHGFAITFWVYVDHDPDRSLDGAELGEELRALHGALAPYPGALPRVAGLIEESERLLAGLAGSDLFAAGEVDRLGALLARAREALDGARLPARPLHGDAHAGNLLRTPDGPLWTDFEDTCRGPIEWDLACLACGRGPGADALVAYGRRPGDPELAPFVAARTLQLAVWTVFVAERRPALRERARERLDEVLE